MEKSRYFIIIIAILAVSAFFIFQPSGKQEAKATGDSFVKSSAPQTPYGSITEAKVEDGKILIQSEIGKIGIEGDSVKIVPMDITVAASSWKLSVTDDTLVSIYGATTWNGVIGENEIKKFDTIISPQKKGLFTVEIKGRIPYIDNQTSGSFCCGFTDSFTALFDGETITMVQGPYPQFCENGYYFDESELNCKFGSPPAVQVDEKDIGYTPPTGKEEGERPGPSNGS